MINMKEKSEKNENSNPDSESNLNPIYKNFSSIKDISNIIPSFPTDSSKKLNETPKRFMKYYENPTKKNKKYKLNSLSLNFDENHLNEIEKKNSMENDSILKNRNNLSLVNPNIFKINKIEKPSETQKNLNKNIQPSLLDTNDQDKTIEKAKNYSPSQLILKEMKGREFLNNHTKPNINITDSKIILTDETVIDEGKEPRHLLKFKNLYDSLSSDDYLSEDMEEGWVIGDDWIIKNIWDIIMLTTMMITCIIEPYVISFSIQNQALLIMETMLDFCFIIDIPVNFFTPFTKDKKKIKNLKTIALNYTKGWFLFDILSSIPSSFLSLIMDDDKGSLGFLRIARLYKILKWARMFKLLKMIKSGFLGKIFSKIKMNENHSIDRLIKFFLLFFFLTHISTCAWVFIGKTSESNHGSSWLSDTNMLDTENFDVYMASYYYNLVTIFTIGYGDIHCMTSTEMIYNVFFMTIGVAMFSFTISSISQIFEKITDKKKIYIDKLRILEDISTNYDIPKETYENVKKNLLFSKNVALEKFELLDELPFALRNEVVVSIINKGIKDVKFFKDQEREFIIFVLPLLRSLNISKNEILIGIGDLLDEMYIVKKGSLSLKLEKNYHNMEISSIVENQNFGEVFMHLNQQCDYLVTGKSRMSHLFALSKNDFNKLKSNFEENVLKILNVAIMNLQKIEKIKNVVIELLNLGVSLKRIKLLIKKINFYFFKKQFESFMQGLEIKEVEELINSHDISDISQFLNSKMTEIDFKKFFHNDVVEKKQTQDLPFSNINSKNRFSIIDNKIFGKFLCTDDKQDNLAEDELVANLKGNFDFSSISSSNLMKEEYQKTLLKLITNQKEDIKNLIPNSLTKKSEIQQIKRKSAKKHKKNKKAHKRTSGNTNSPKTIYNIFKCTNSYNQNFQLRFDKFENLQITDGAHINLNGTLIKVEDSNLDTKKFEICKNYSMSYNNNTWTFNSDKNIKINNLDSPKFFEFLKRSSSKAILNNKESEIISGLDRIFSIIKNNNK